MRVRVFDRPTGQRRHRTARLGIVHRPGELEQVGARLAVDQGNVHRGRLGPNYVADSDTAARRSSVASIVARLWAARSATPLTILPMNTMNLPRSSVQISVT